MATVIKELPTNRAGRPAAPYEWNKWADGRAWQIKRGTDFTCSIESMRGSIYYHAQNVGVTVTTRQIDADTLAFQFSKPAKRK